MKTIIHKNRYAILICLILIVGATIAILLYNNWFKTIIQTIQTSSILTSISYAFIFILGFNLIIFIIGRLSKNKEKLNRVHEIKKVRSNRRRRRFESDYVKMSFNNK